MSTNTNGRAQRKSLAEQLDRLDAILDGLADALDESVAEAVKVAVAVAVREAVKQVLTNPEVLRGLASPSPVPEPVRQPSALRRLVERARHSCSWLGGRVADGTRRLKRRAGVLLTAVRTGVAARAVKSYRRALAVAGWLWHARRAVGVAGVVGLLTGLVGYAAGPLMSAVLCGLGGLGVALGVRVTLPVLRLLGAVGGEA